MKEGLALLLQNFLFIISSLRKRCLSVLSAALHFIFVIKSLAHNDWFSLKTKCKKGKKSRGNMP